MMVLDIERVLAREPKAVEPFLDEIRDVAAAEPRLIAALADLETSVTVRAPVGRRLTTQLALAMQAALLVRHAPAAVADAFCASRLAGDGGLQYGTLPAAADVQAIVERHTPQPG
jgi:putative acyl-CoA dehydrogenase